MKNKKGFTLVELLAVIAILAILVIMALPAVLRMFNSARKDSFTNEVNTVLRTARQQYLLSGGSDTKWSNAEGSTKTLYLTGNNSLKYYVEMNGNGQIIKLQVTNGDFQYNKSGVIDIANAEDVKEISALDPNEVLVITDNNTKRIKLTTPIGSFSPSETVQELYVDAIDDGYIYQRDYYAVSSGSKIDDNYFAIIKIEYKYFNENSYIEVYDNNTNALIKRITYDMAPKARIDIRTMTVLPNTFSTVEIGNYDWSDLRMVLSSDLEATLTSDFTAITRGHVNGLSTEYYSGPWIDMNSPEGQQVIYFKEHISGYVIKGFTYNPETGTYEAVLEESIPIK